MAFAVVKFINTDKVAAVPANWVANDFCSWPPKTLQSKVAPYIEKGISFSDAWDKYAVKTLGLFATYSEARQKLIAAQESSDLNTSDVEHCSLGKRNKKRSTRCSSSESEEDYSQDLLAFPLLPDVSLLLIENTKVVEHPHIVRFPVNKVQDFLETSNFIAHPAKPSQDQSARSSKQLGFFETSSSNCKPYLTTPSHQQIQSAQSSKELGFRRLVLHELNIIKGQQKIIMESLNTMMGTTISKPAPSHISTDFNDLLNVLPLANEEDLKQVEENLQNQETANNMVLYLSKIGGNCLENGVKNMLKRLLSDELASEYSYLGVRGKKVFKDLKICSIIKDAVNMSAWKDATEMSIQVVIMNWLRHSKARFNNKKRKICI